MIRRRGLALLATSLDASSGGVAAANGAALGALRALGREFGAPVEALTLHDPREDARENARGSRSDDRDGARIQGCASDRFAFAVAALKIALRARLVLFDHTHLTAAWAPLPRALRPAHGIIAHGSEVGRRLRPGDAARLAAADLVLTNSQKTLRAMRAALEPALGPRALSLGVACPLGLPASVAPTTAPPSAAETAAALADLSLTAADGAARPLGRRMLLLVGRMDASEGEKGQREMIDALAPLRARHPEAQLVLAGGGSDEASLRAYAAASPAAGAIFLTGKAQRPLLDQLYQAAFAYAMPSRQEGFGLVYLEAMNRAKPCLACRGDGGAEVVAEGETGLLIDAPPAPEAIAEALAGLMADPGRAEALGRAGWRRLAAEFTAEAHEARLIAQLRPLLAGPTPRRAAAQAAAPLGSSNA